MRTQTDARDCLRYSAEESRLYKALKLAGTPVGVHLASRVNSAFPAMAAALGLGSGHLTVAHALLSHALAVVHALLGIANPATLAGALLEASRFLLVVSQS